MKTSIKVDRSSRGFTLIEILTALIIIFILMMMSLQAFSSLEAKAERANCTSNLKNLYVATNSYIQDQRCWPQLGMPTADTPEFAKAWIAVLAPYKIAPANWICPTAQRGLGNPSYLTDKGIRIDYFPTVYGPGPNTPFQWPTHPWFAERGDVHGNGNLLIFANGQVQSLNDVLTGMRLQIAQ